MPNIDHLPFSSCDESESEASSENENISSSNHSDTDSCTSDIFCLPDIEDVEFESFSASQSEPLYHNSPVNTIQAVAMLFSWFSAFSGVSKEALSRLLYLLNNFILPTGNRLPTNYSSAHDLIKSFLAPVEEYHCCVNDCVIFRGVNKDCSQCPECSEDRYFQGAKIPRKRYKYLPLSSRILQLFRNPKTSQLLQSHTCEETIEVADIHQTETWRQRYSQEGVFKGDPRALSLAICGDGTNPFSKEKCQYSMWPIVTSILNLPARLRRQCGFLQLVGIIPGKSEPKKLDPYLELLVDELLELNGLQVFDGYQNNWFKLQVDIFLHVLDYPGQNKMFHCQGERWLYSA